MYLFSSNYVLFHLNNMHDILKSKEEMGNGRMDEIDFDILFNNMSRLYIG